MTSHTVSIQTVSSHTEDERLWLSDSLLKKMTLLLVNATEIDLEGALSKYNITMTDLWRVSEHLNLGVNKHKKAIYRPNVKFFDTLFREFSSTVDIDGSSLDLHPILTSQDLKDAIDLSSVRFDVKESGTRDKDTGEMLYRKEYSGRQCHIISLDNGLNNGELITLKLNLDVFELSNQSDLLTEFHFFYYPELNNVAINELITDTATEILSKLLSEGGKSASHILQRLHKRYTPEKVQDVLMMALQSLSEDYLTLGPLGPSNTLAYDLHSALSNYNVERLFEDYPEIQSIRYHIDPTDPSKTDFHVLIEGYTDFEPVYGKALTIDRSAPKGQLLPISNKINVPLVVLHSVLKQHALLTGKLIGEIASSNNVINKLTQTGEDMGVKP